MQRGLERLWPYAGELFEADEVVQRLAAAGTAVDPASLRDGWDRHLDADPGRGHPGPPGRRLAARQRPPGRPQRAPGLPAGRDAVPAPPAPGSPLVSASVATETARGLAGRVADPEIPVLTIEDLGILRDVVVDDDGNVEVTVTPTYSGCPAMDVIRADVTRTLREHGYGEVRVRTVLAPAWTTDWMSAEGRAKLAAYGIAPPGPRPAGPVPVQLTTRRPEPVACPQLRLRRHPRGQPLRLHRLQVAPHLPGLPGAVRPLQDAVAMAPTGKRKPAFHLLRVAELDRITDDAVAITFDVPEELADEYRFTAGQHLALRCTIAGDDVRRNYSICTPASAGRLRVGVKRLPGGVFSSYAMERLRVGDTHRGADPHRAVLHPAGPGPGQALRGRRRRVGDHPDPVDHRQRPRGRARQPGHADLRQPDHRQHHVPGGAGGPQEPLPGPLPAHPRPRRRVARGRAAHRPPGPRPAHRAPGHPGRYPTWTSGSCAAPST